MSTTETTWKKTDRPARYHAGDDGIELGDRVEYRGWFRRRQGVVSYVPGISAPHPEMEHGGLCWVGVAYDDGTFTGILVDPATGRTRKGLVLIRRGDGDEVPPLPEDDEW